MLMMPSGSATATWLPSGLKTAAQIAPLFFTFGRLKCLELTSQICASPLSVPRTKRSEVGLGAIQSKAEAVDPNGFGGFDRCFVSQISRLPSWLADARYLPS